MNKTQIISELESLIIEGKENVLPSKWLPKNVINASWMVDYSKYTPWHAKSLTFIKMFLPPESDFITSFAAYEKNYYTKACSSITTLENIRNYIDKGIISIDSYCQSDANTNLSNCFQKFHMVARQLRSRHDNRETIIIRDEYDVQDLLHGLLRIYFDDIRPEEWTPSYAGKSARVDFLLKKEQIVIEVKKTRESLTEKELGDQLIVDVERYKSHPDCKKLWCFIYDPEEHIANPDGLMNDLMRQHNGFVTVLVEPRYY